MSEENKQLDAAAAVAEEELEERREVRQRKTWLIKLFSLSFTFVLMSSVLTLLYAAVIQEKDLNTGFIGEILKAIFDFLRFVMT